MGGTGFQPLQQRRWSPFETGCLELFRLEAGTTQIGSVPFAKIQRVTLTLNCHCLLPAASATIGRSPREGVPMRPLRVAVLDEELPFPATSGKRIRTFNLLSRLAERHRVTVLCHRNPDP